MVFKATSSYRTITSLILLSLLACNAVSSSDSPQSSTGSGQLSNEELENPITSLFIESFLYQNQAFMDFLRQEDKEASSNDIFKNLPAKDCSFVSQKLSSKKSSVYFTVEPHGKRLIYAINCLPNDQGLRRIVFFGSRAFESQDIRERLFNLKIFRYAFSELKLVQEINQVKLCEKGFVEPLSGDCKELRYLRRLTLSDTEAQDMYDDYLVDYEVPAAISLMMSEDITSSFYITLISELQTYSSEEVFNEDDYSSVQAAIYNMMTYTGFALDSIAMTYFDDLFKCLKSAASAIACDSSSSYTCTTFQNQKPQVAEIVYLYLEISKDATDTDACFYTSTTYQKAVTTAYDYAAEIFAIIYNYDQTLTDPVSDVYSSSGTTIINLIVTRFLGSDDTSSNECDFNLYPFIGLSITIQIAQSAVYGFLSDVYGFRVYKIGIEGDDLGSDDLIDYEEQTIDVPCFTLSKSLGFTGTDSDTCTYEYTSTDFKTTVENVVADSDSSTISFDYTDFGLYGFIKCCADGYGLINTQECVSCGTGCKCKCYGGCSACSSETTCVSCSSGYYLSSNTCSACTSISNCAECSDASTCTKCKSGYVLSSGACLACSTVANCVACSNGYSCTSCGSGYFVQSGACSACSSSIPNCAACSDEPTCTSCGSGYFLQSGSCSACSSSIPNCAVCSDESTCTSCGSGYFLENDACLACSSSISNCAVCSDGSTCTSCDSGYFVKGGLCSKCSSSISHCAVCSDGSTCTSCGSGYKVNDMKSCSSCKSYIKESDVIEFTYSSDFKYLQIEFSVELNSVSRCSDVSFNYSSFGKNPKCSLSKDKKFINVTLGEKWEPLQSLSLKTVLTKVDPTEEFCEINPSETIIVTANLTGLIYFTGGRIDTINEIYTGCSNLAEITCRLYDLNDLTGLGVSYTWSINSTETDKDSKVNEEIQDTNKNFVDIDFSDYRGVDGDVTFNVMVFNKFNENYTISLDIKLINNKKITIAIDGDSVVKVDSDSELKFSALLVDKCGSKKNNVKYKWTYVGTDDKFTFEQNNINIHIKKGQLLVGEEYKFNVTAQLDNFKSNTVQLALELILKDIIVVLKAPFMVTTNKTLKFDASESRDPNKYAKDIELNYKWSCIKPTNICKDITDYLISNDTIEFSLKNNHNSDYFIIQVNVSNDYLSTVQTAKITIQEPGEYTITMTFSTERVSFSNFNLIYGISSASEQGQLTYEWNIPGVNSDKYISNNLFLLILPYAFNTGETYQLSLKVTRVDKNKESNILGELYSNNAPSCSDFSISPSSGKMFDDIFTITATCSDIEEDYPLYGVVSFAFSEKPNWPSNLKKGNNYRSFRSRMPKGKLIIQLSVCDTMDDCISSNFSINIKSKRRLLEESIISEYTDLVEQDINNAPNLCIVLAASQDLGIEFWQQVLEDLETYLNQTSYYYTLAEINSALSCVYWLLSDKQESQNYTYYEKSYDVIFTLFDKFSDRNNSDDNTLTLDDYGFEVFMAISDAFINYAQILEDDFEKFNELLEKGKNIQLTTYEKYFYKKTSGLSSFYKGSNFNSYKKIINYFDTAQRSIDISKIEDFSDNKTRIDLLDSISDNNTQVGVMITTFNTLGNYTKHADAVEVKLTKEGLIKNDAYESSSDTSLDFDKPIEITVNTVEDITKEEYYCGYWNASGSFFNDSCEISEVGDKTATLKVSHLSFYGLEKIPEPIIPRTYESCEVNHAPIIIMAVVGFIMVLLIPVMVMLDSYTEVSEAGENINPENGISRTIEYSPRSPASLTERPLASLSDLSVPDVEEISESIIENPNAADYTIEFKLRSLDYQEKKIEKNEKSCFSSMIEGHLLFGLYVKRPIFIRPLRLLTLFSTLILQLFLEGIFLFYGYGTDDSENVENDERSTQTLFDDYKGSYFGYLLVALAIAIPYEILLIVLFSKDWKKPLLRTLGILLIVVVVGGSIAGIIILTLDFCFKWSGYWAVSFLWGILIEIFFLQIVYMMGRYLVKTEDK